MAPTALPDEDAAPPSLAEIFWTFTKVSLTSFGGGLSGWIMREVVQHRRWIGEAEFMAGLALAQSFPGVNVVNLSIWIGFRMRGGPGALVGALGMVVPAMAVCILVLTLFAQVQHYTAAHLILAGISAAAIGLSLQMGLRSLWRCATGLAPVLVVAGTFGGIFLLGLPLIWVVLVMAPISVFLAFRRIRLESNR